MYVYTGWSKSLCTSDYYSTTLLYWKVRSRTQFGVSINVWRLTGDTLNITGNFLYCNHQVHRDFLITLYMAMSTPWRRTGGIELIAPFILKIGVRWRWVVKFTPRGLPSPWERAFEQEAVWAPGFIWKYCRIKKSQFNLLFLLPLLSFKNCKAVVSSEEDLSICFCFANRNFASKAWIFSCKLWEFKHLWGTSSLLLFWIQNYSFHFVCIVS
jgi:hypothetical protein